MSKIYALFSLLLLSATAMAQQGFTISGTIKNIKGDQLPSVTVFIAGSQKATAANQNGAYSFQQVDPGTYQIIFNLIGYEPIKRNIIIKDQSVVFDTVMHERPIELDMVAIGDSNKKNKFLKTFTQYFLGESDNGKSCKILNPEKIDFSTNKNLLKANSQDFLLIDNKNLGYRVKYLLRNFQYNDKAEVTFYEGESIFENMEGTAEQKANWEANRKKAYEGSLMHYLRALHTNTAQEEGFLTYLMLNFNQPIVIAPNPVFTEQLINRTDSNFYHFTYKKRLYIIYDKKEAAKEQKLSKRTSMTVDMEKTGSILMLHAEIDKRGSYSDYKAILIQGYWGKQRLGDQLPIEYDQK